MPLKTIFTESGQTLLANNQGQVLLINASGIVEFGWRTFEAPIFAVGPTTALSVADGVAYWEVGPHLNGATLTAVRAYIPTAGSSGNNTIQVRDRALNQNILSTAITVEVSETSSSTAATQPVINATYEQFYTGQVIAIDVDAVSTGAAGLQVTLLGHFGAP